MAEERKVEMVIPKQPVAIVVGASSGIGRETAIRLCCEGYRVFNLSRTPFYGEQVRSISVDASKEGELREGIRTVGEEVKRIDVLVYSAGFSMLAPVEHAKSEDYRYLFEVNYFGAIEAIQAVLPYMTGRTSRIVLVGSIAGDLPIPFDGFYCASKAALCMLARETDLQMRNRGIRVSVFLPGGTATNFSFRRRVYKERENGSYTLSLKRAQAALCNVEQGGKTASFVADRLLKHLKKGNPPPVAVAGWKNVWANRFSRLLSARCVGWFMRKKFHQKRG